MNDERRAGCSVAPKTQDRVGTFDLGDTDQDDQFAVERAWNRWCDELFAVGLRPADQPERSGPSWATFRLFPVDEENETHVLDFDIGKFATLGGLVAIAVGTAIGMMTEGAPGFDLIARLVSC